MPKLILLHPQELNIAQTQQVVDQFTGGTHHIISTKAASIEINEDIFPETKKRIQDFCFALQIDTIFLKDHFQPEDFRVLAFDMDSTLINIECIDEIARSSGKWAEVSAITEASMRGEITDFEESLRKRVELLKGVSENVLEHVYTQELRFNPGAQHLIQGAQERGWHTVLVSGGFNFFTKRIQHRLGLDEAYANTLEIVDGKLTGRVLGAVVDGQAKAGFVQAACAQFGLPASSAITIGDGSNDLPMMSISGLSIGFKPKPIVQKNADGCLRNVGLDAILELFPIQ